MSADPTATGPTVPTWPGLLGALLRGDDLTADDTAWAMAQVMSGDASAAQISAFAVLLRAKGESADEVAGLVRTMLDFAVPVSVDGPALDIVGSGGDRSHSVNISTMSAIVAAAAGARIAKHGNRAASSACGAADLLEELGVAFDLGAEGVAACVESVGIGFCFAPVFHPGYRHAGPVRREIGVPTAFNFLGPLTNPARPVAVAVGCADARMAAVTADVLAGRGARGLVFRGDDGLDELTTTTTSRAWVVTGGSVTETVVDPAALDIAPATAEQLRGGDACANAEVARDLLAGKPGAVRDAVLLNAAAGLVAWEGPDPGTLTQQLRAAMERCAQAIDSGDAARKLERWVEVSRAQRG